MSEPETTPTRPGSSSQASAISELLVRTVREYTGRGPTIVRTVINESLITVVLEDTLTSGERSLVRDGHGDLVIEMRRTFQRTMSATLIDGIEQITGRTIRAFLSDNHIDPDVAVETFLLEPRTHTEPSSTAAAPTR